MKTFLITAFMSISIYSFAQDDNEYQDDEFVGLKQDKKYRKIDLNKKKFSSAVFKLSFFMPSVATELRLSDKFSIELAGKLNFAIYISTSSNPQSTPKFYFFPLPVAHIEPKWNYNIKRRLEKGKNISGFSSNFLSLFTSYRIKVSNNTYDNLLVGPTWGIQRKLGKLGYFKFNAGMVYNYIFDANIRAQQLQQSILGIPIDPIVDIQLGIMF